LWHEVQTAGIGGLVDAAAWPSAAGTIDIMLTMLARPITTLRRRGRRDTTLLIFLLRCNNTGVIARRCHATRIECAQGIGGFLRAK
jgi:hypothetical protein